MTICLIVDAVECYVHLMPYYASDNLSYRGGGNPDV